MLGRAQPLRGPPLTFAPVDLAAVVTQTTTRHQLLQPPRGVRGVLNPAPDTGAHVWVRGNETKLERLLDNLISNAIKFSPDDGVVHVWVTDDGRDAVRLFPPCWGRIEELPRNLDQPPSRASDPPGRLTRKQVRPER